MPKARHGSLGGGGTGVQGGRGGMLIFDTTIAFEPDETAVIWARTLQATRFRLCVTRRYAEQTWRIRYSEAEVTTMIWLHIDELRKAAARSLTDGNSELVL